MTLNRLIARAWKVHEGHHRAQTVFGFLGNAPLFTLAWAVGQLLAGGNGNVLEVAAAEYSGCG